MNFFKKKVIGFLIIIIVVFCGSLYLLNKTRPRIHAEIENDITYEKQGTPQMYGAVGDGLTDDTEAFQQALNNHRSIYVPAGTYLVGDLVMPWGVTITGDSAVTTILKAKDGTETVLQMDTNTQAGAHIYKITVECDNKAEYGIRFPVISIENNTDMTLYNLLFDEVYVNNAKYRNISIESNAIEARMFEVRTMNSGGTGCYFRGTDSIFVSCMFASAKENGLHIFGANNRVSASKAYLNGTTSEHAGILVQGDTCLFDNLEIQQNYANGMIVRGCGNVIRGLMDGNNGFGQTEQIAQIILDNNSWYNTIDITVMSWKFFNYTDGKMLPQYGVICRGSNQIFNHIQLTVGGIAEYYEQNKAPSNSLIPFYVEYPSPLNIYECNGERYFETEAIELMIRPFYQEYGLPTTAMSINSSTVKFSTEKKEGIDYSARYIINSAEMNSALSSVKDGDTILITGKAKGPQNSQIIPQISYQKAEDNTNSGWTASDSLVCRSINYSPFYVALRNIKAGDNNFKLGFLLQENVSKGNFPIGSNDFYIKDLKLYVIPKSENEIFDINIQN